MNFVALAIQKRNKRNIRDLYITELSWVTQEHLNKTKTNSFSLNLNISLMQYALKGKGKQTYKVNKVLNYYTVIR